MLFPSGEYCSLLPSIEHEPRARRLSRLRLRTTSLFPTFLGRTPPFTRTAPVGFLCNVEALDCFFLRVTTPLSHFTVFALPPDLVPSHATASDPRLSSPNFLSGIGSRFTLCTVAIGTSCFPHSVLLPVIQHGFVLLLRVARYIISNVESCYLCHVRLYPGTRYLVGRPSAFFVTQRWFLTTLRVLCATCFSLCFGTRLTVRGPARLTRRPLPLLSHCSFRGLYFPPGISLSFPLLVFLLSFASFLLPLPLVC